MGIQLTLLLYSLVHICAAGPDIGAATGEIQSATQKILASLYPEVETSVDRNEILIGDVFNLSITITHDPSVRILEKGKNFNLGQFEIKDIVPGKVEKLPNGKIHRTDVYKLSTYFTGEFVIPPFDIRFQTEDGRTGSFYTSPITINVRSLTPEESENLDIRDIKNPVLLEGQSRMPYVLAGAGILLLLAVLALWLWRRYKKRGKPVEETPPVPPHEWAYRELQSLRERHDLIEERRYKEFAILLSDIIRIYIQGRWGILAIDYTTEEILNELEDLQMDEEIYGSFQRFFEDCDLIKFAKYETTPEAASQMIDEAENLVDKTKDESMLSPIMIDGIAPLQSHEYETLKQGVV